MTEALYNTLHIQVVLIRICAIVFISQLFAGERGVLAERSFNDWYRGKGARFCRSESFARRGSARGQGTGAISVLCFFISGLGKTRSCLLVVSEAVKPEGRETRGQDQA
jgi:hypothetical protein